MRQFGVRGRKEKKKKDIDELCGERGALNAKAVDVGWVASPADAAVHHGA